MKTLMKKQMSSGFVIITVAVMMITSQIPEAFTDEEIICIDQTLIGTIKGNIVVPTTDGFNLCVLDNVDLEGNITVLDNAAIFVHNGSDLRSDIKLEGQFSAINFEGTDINFLKGNVQGKHEDSYIYLDSVTIEGNVQGKGEVYVSSNRGSGEVRVLGNYLVDGNLTTEFVLNGIFVGGNVFVAKQLSVKITGTEVVGNVHIKDNENNLGLMNIEGNEIGGKLELEKNEFGSGISIFSNDISKGLQLKDNFSIITIEGNDVRQNVLCEKNDAILGADFSNFVDGQTKKDCKGLDLFKGPENFP